jgi:hypothetical protein
LKIAIRYFCVSRIDIVFDLQQIQNFGDPFVLVVHEGETLAEVKKRIQSKLQVSADEFSKVIHLLKFLLMDGVTTYWYS